jgi:NAD(P)H-dependent flavin oxidoreductase YrpB (nitropropane dioxygenase family)
MGVGISLSGLASASANEGCVGVIAANAIGMIEDDYLKDGKQANIRALRKEIRKAKANTDGPIGINIMVATNDFHDLLNVSIEERADIVILGAGLPIKNIPVSELRAANVKVIPIVSSSRAVNLIFRSWKKKYSDVPDAVIVEGPMAGGHLGYKHEEIEDPEFTLEKIVPPVIESLKPFEQDFDREIPVIAAGGIYTGEDILKFLNLGAKGVQMGTRFVATHECDADLKFKETYLDCKEGDVMIIKSPVGMPGRAIRNQFLTDVENGIRQKFKCPWRCLEHCNIKSAKYCISSALDNARLGFMDHGYAFAGSNAHRIQKIVPVKELVEDLRKEFIQAQEEK